MKITFEKFVKYAFPTILGAFTYMTYDIVKDAKNYRSIDDIQKEIQKKDPKRYDSLLNNNFYGRSFEEWVYEEKLMNESIKIDSLVKRAYFEGAQMVRDSIRNAEITQ